MNGGPGGFVEGVGCGAKPTRREVAEKGGEVEQAECTKAPAMPFRFSTLLQLTTVTASQFLKKKTVTAPRDDRKQSMDEK